MKHLKHHLISLKFSWNTLKAPLKIAWTTLETSYKYPLNLFWNTLDKPPKHSSIFLVTLFLEHSFLKHLWNILETPFQLFQCSIEIPLEHLLISIEIQFNLPWNSLKFLQHSWNFLKTPWKMHLNSFKKFLKTSLKYPWNSFKTL